MSELISVIVPVYKVEPYLRKCVDSIRNQTYQNLEIILVDDGSPDACGQICDAYAEIDSRIKVIHKPNGGLSDARNAGMDIMTGEYVGFVDSDDWIEPTMYQKLLDNLEQFHADMSFGGVANEEIRDFGTVCTKTSNYGDEPFAESHVDAMKRYFRGSWAAWDKLYRRELFDGIRYPVGEINEDEAIVLHLLDRCERVCYTNEVFYHYINRPASITTSDFSKKKLAWKEHCAANLAYIQEHYPELTLYAAERYRGSLMWSLSEIAMTKEPAAYDVETANMITALKANRELFRAAPFRQKREKIRYWVLTHCGFGFYKTALRLKRGVNAR